MISPKASNKAPNSVLPTLGGNPPINTVVFSGCVLLESGSGKKPPDGAGAANPVANALARVVGEPQDPSGSHEH